jgi:alpha-tubulin suppressor-like RCC1 family protein
MAWGDNGRGQCSVPRSTKFRAIAAGTWHSLGIRIDGSIAAWGWNENHQCDVPAGKDFVEVCGGYSHSLALRSDGTIVAWGSNGDGQASVPEGNNFVHIAAGTMHSLALRATARLSPGAAVRKASVESVGQRFHRPSPPAHSHNLALRRDGRVEAWGQTTTASAPSRTAADTP